MSTADIVKIQQHILGKSILENPYEILSADVDMNEKININDIMYGSEDLFLESPQSSRSKVLPFMDKNIVFTQPNNPWPDYYRTQCSGRHYKKNGSVVGLTGIKLMTSIHLLHTATANIFVIYYRIEQNSLVFRTKNEIDVLGFSIKFNLQCPRIFDPSINTLFIDEGYDREFVFNKMAYFN